MLLLVCHQTGERKPAHILMCDCLSAWVTDCVSVVSFKHVLFQTAHFLLLNSSKYTSSFHFALSAFNVKAALVHIFKLAMAQMTLYK